MNETVNFHIDTGAEVSVIPDHVHQKLDSPVQRVQGVQTGKLNPIQKFPSLFQDLGKLQGECTIKIQEGAN